MELWCGEHSWWWWQRSFNIAAENFCVQRSWTRAEHFLLCLPTALSPAWATRVWENLIIFFFFLVNETIYHISRYSVMVQDLFYFYFLYSCFQSQSDHWVVCTPSLCQLLVVVLWQVFSVFDRNNQCSVLVLWEASAAVLPLQLPAKLVWTELFHRIVWFLHWKSGFCSFAMWSEY